MRVGVGGWVLVYSLKNRLKIQGRAEGDVHLLLYGRVQPEMDVTTCQSALGRKRRAKW